MQNVCLIAEIIHGTMLDVFSSLRNESDLSKMRGKGKKTFRDASQLSPGFTKVRATLFIFSTNQIRSSNQRIHQASSHELFRQLGQHFCA